ncbi:sugar O-acyltransferase, sialic acid O-acetyltransferase NeuD family [Chryseolinea serpens]|uniref:Sugar O-acyltransferase, sialic acid O-acetyltransferase NeuD family n=1 Tax=Chryseolinea serpens TaxID=947013 RepID=A0A1M5MFB6_9BACT|nr:acetyltransferase [Chryseolinea serpens]SHG75403.1 sugar O-acyltransferase, sialic acid O-acetyltransferase NeuD family [Chryseolinea serpens]
MVVAGAKGFAKEVLEILAQCNDLENLYFFDDLSNPVPEKLVNRFPVLRTMEDVKKVFQQTGDLRFTLGLGNPVFRYRLCQRFLEAGGKLASTVSPNTDIGRFENKIGDGCNILSGTIITSHVTIGSGCLINPGCILSHDSVIGNFVELSPGVRITGSCSIGDYSVLGTNAVILPKVRVGQNVVVGAGAVITKDVPDNCVIAGVPGVIRRTLSPLELANLFV